MIMREETVFRGLGSTASSRMIMVRGSQAPGMPTLAPALDRSVSVGPEQARSPRIRGIRHPALRSLLARDHAGFTEVTHPEQIVLPATASVPLILKIRDSAHRPPAFVSGPHGSHLEMDGACAPAYLEVWLAPLGAYVMLGLPLREISGQTVDLVDLFGADGRRLAEKVRASPDWTRRFGLVDEFLLRRTEIGPRPSPQVRRAWHQLTRSGGRTPIGRLAAEVGWSHKHLTSMFRQQVGLPPKTVARLVRFDRVLAGVGQARRPNWSDLATTAGYADQPHLVREFREFTGTTPTRYAARLRSGG
jgi:AraC-like DNA-binding protein